jgi:hypothetical protein
MSRERPAHTSIAGPLCAVLESRLLSHRQKPRRDIEFQSQDRSLNHGPITSCTVDSRSFRVVLRI